MKTYNIYTVIFKGTIDGQPTNRWDDLSGHGCFENEARAAAATFKAAHPDKPVAVRIDTYKRSKTVQPPIGTKFERI